MDTFGIVLWAEFHLLPNLYVEALTANLVLFRGRHWEAIRFPWGYAGGAPGGEQCSIRDTGKLASSLCLWVCNTHMSSAACHPGRTSQKLSLPTAPSCTLQSRTLRCDFLTFKWHVFNFSTQDSFSLAKYLYNSGLQGYKVAIHIKHYYYSLIINLSEFKTLLQHADIFYHVLDKSKFAF